MKDDKTLSVPVLNLNACVPPPHCVGGAVHNIWSSSFFLFTGYPVNPAHNLPDVIQRRGTPLS